ncbi:DUF3515 domain-containing protein [Cellulomonas wangsupingiae]|uniref:DUF3515 domain-containing protein n=1 Tax=Cellulomonas wangsupingiae TaxID=2968085 RepID=A0ABY5K234_9CELL|nr:DUF3515 domain-containing protein [Cellulomonas wangsupingiae]MCC2335627.1 DUF3515 domain-containing protein [Cellulomonas wangsupingiae]UUI63864.1 DUF3515 domain-containing protein [Cellulomonas wangsupingiae]
MHHRPTVLTAAATVTLLGVSACSSTVPVTVAPHATDPVCASVVLSLPASLGDGLTRVDTDAQATAAWGEPREAVVLRCGVEPPGPTTDRCESVTTPGGPTVDWVVVEDDGDWTFTTYGRVPAVELRVPAAVAAERSTSFVDLLGPAVARTAQERSCL